MDEPKPQQPDGGAQPAPPVGVAIDIVPPKASDPAKAAPPAPEPTSSVPTPASDPVATPVAEEPQKSIDLNAIKPVPVLKLPKQPKNGTGLAIFATVVIVLGLGAMMVYAYLRTKGISIP